MVSSEAGLLLRTMSGPAFLPQLGSVLIPMPCNATKGYVDVQGLGHNLWPCWLPRAMPPPGPCWSKWPALSPVAMVSSGTGPLARAMSESIPYCSQGLYWCSRLLLAMRAVQMPGIWTATWDHFGGMMEKQGGVFVSLFCFNWFWE